MLDNVRVGVLQLDRRGRIAAANDQVRMLLRSGDGLWDEDGCPHTSWPDEDAALQRLLARALPFLGGPGIGGSMRVSRAQTLSRLVLHVGPLCGTGLAHGQGHIGALVPAVDPADRTELDPQWLGEALGLTPAESVVAALLAQGKSIDEVAAQTGRAASGVPL